MKNMSKFQLVFTGIFAAFIVIGVLIFALIKMDSTQTSVVTVWGTMPGMQFKSFIDQTSLSKDETVSVMYYQKDKDSFDNELLKAMAVEKGPDVFFLSIESILKNKDKLVVVPFENYAERDFKNNFIEEGELFLTKEGVMAVPLIVDPLVMYWNRDILGSAGLSNPPKSWKELYDLAPKLTKKDSSLKISRSTVALGEIDNITNANEILSALLIQSGNQIVSYDANQNRYTANLNDNTKNVFSFYTDFSTSLKPYYSWNKALPDSKDYFISNDLALYFGKASDYSDIASKNPNLNFDVTYLPQPDLYDAFITYGEMQGLAISRSARDIASAFKVINILTSKDSISALSKVINLPPVRRDLLSQKASGTFMPIFYKSAIGAKGWLQPDKTGVDNVYKYAVGLTNSSNIESSEIVNGMESRLNLLLNQ